MLSARRDPIMDHGTPVASSPPHAGHAVLRPTGFARFIAGLQVAATMLAIPVGLASGYSIYRVNFSPEASCGTLRANIISMLDKNADASTLRLLVRKDVASFERSCASVDPDAVAAFKTLLIKPATVVAAKETKPAKSEKEAVRATPALAESAKRVAATAEIESAPARHNPDAVWLAAVRRALVEHPPVTRAHAVEEPMPLAAPPVVQPVGQSRPVPARTHDAPPLPPATAVADTPASQSGESHPVPPAPIPNVGPAPAR